MLWQDVLVAQRANDASIVAATAAAFGLPSADVAVVDDLEEMLTRVAPATRLLVQRTMTGGDFPMLLSIYVLDRLIEQRLADLPVGLAHVQRLARMLGADLLISDATTPGDEEGLLVRPQGTVERVLLDAGGLDRDVYRIVRWETPIRTPIPA